MKAVTEDSPHKEEARGCQGIRVRVFTRIPVSSEYDSPYIEEAGGCQEIRVGAFTSNRCKVNELLLLFEYTASLTLIPIESAGMVLMSTSE